jgi:hypothetical protein
MGYAAAQSTHDIAQSRCTQRSHYANAVRLRRQAPLACGVKKAVPFQLSLEAQKLLKQRTLPSGLQAIYNQLQVTPRAIHIQFATGFYPQPITWVETKLIGRSAKHGTAYLPCLVFQHKVAMTAGRTGKTRQLTADHDRVETASQSVGNSAHQRTNRPNPPSWRELLCDVQLSHWSSQRKTVHSQWLCWLLGRKMSQNSRCWSKLLISLYFARPVLSSCCPQ